MEQPQRRVQVGDTRFAGGPALVKLRDLARQFGALGDKRGNDVRFSHAASVWKHAENFGGILDAFAT